MQISNIPSMRPIRNNGFLGSPFLWCHLRFCTEAVSNLILLSLRNNYPPSDEFIYIKTSGSRPSNHANCLGLLESARKEARKRCSTKKPLHNWNIEILLGCHQDDESDFFTSVYKYCLFFSSAAAAARSANIHSCLPLYWFLCLSASSSSSSSSSPSLSFVYLLTAANESMRKLRVKEDANKQIRSLPGPGP